MTDQQINSLIENEREWRRFCVKDISDIKTSQAQIQKDIAALKVKAGMWGAGSAVIVTLAAILVKGFI